MQSANRSLVRAGFLLFACALVTGVAIPLFLNPRMALAAHLTGIMNGLVLIALGLAWGLLNASEGRKTLARRLFLYAAFTNWAGSCLAAAWGTGRLTPLSASGFGATAWKEALVVALQLSVALTVLSGAVLVILALRAAPGRPESA